MPERHNHTLGGLRAGSAHGEAGESADVPFGSNRRLAVSLLLAFAIALVAAHVLALPAEPLSVAFDDELHYAQQARDVAAGGFPRFNRIFAPFVPPLYGVVQAPARFLAGRAGWDWWSRAVNALLLASALAPLYCLGRRFLSPGWAAIAAAVSLVSPSQVYVRYLLSESLYIPLSLWLALAVTRLCERPSNARALQTGLVLGLCYLTKTLVIASIPAVPLALLWSLRSPRQVLQACVPLAGAALLVVLPWWFRGLLFPSERDLFVAFTYEAGFRRSGLQPLTTYLEWTWKTASSFLIGLGPLAFLLGSNGLLDGTTSRDPVRRGFSVFTLTSVLASLAMVGIATAQWAPMLHAKVHERYLIGFWPLFILSFVLCLRTVPVSRVTLAVAGAAVLAVTLGMPSDSFEPGSSLLNPIDFPSSVIVPSFPRLGDPTNEIRLLYLALAAPALLVWSWRPRWAPAVLLLLGAGYQGWGAWIAMQRADSRNAWSEEAYRPVWDWLDGIVQEGDVLLHHHAHPKIGYQNAMRYELDYCPLQADLTPEYIATVRLDRPPGRYRTFDYAPQPRFWLLTDVAGEIPVPGVLSHGDLRLIPLPDGNLSGLDALLGAAAAAAPAPPVR